MSRRAAVLLDALCACALLALLAAICTPVLHGSPSREVIDDSLHAALLDAARTRAEQCRAAGSRSAIETLVAAPLRTAVGGTPVPCRVHLLERRGGLGAHAWLVVEGGNEAVSVRIASAAPEAEP